MRVSHTRFHWTFFSYVLDSNRLTTILSLTKTLTENLFTEANIRSDMCVPEYLG